MSVKHRCTEIMINQQGRIKRSSAKLLQATYTLKLLQHVIKEIQRTSKPQGTEEANIEFLYVIAFSN